MELCLRIHDKRMLLPIIIASFMILGNFDCLCDLEAQPCYMLAVFVCHYAPFDICACIVSRLCPLKAMHKLPVIKLHFFSSRFVSRILMLVKWDICVWWFLPCPIHHLLWAMMFGYGPFTRKYRNRLKTRSNRVLGVPLILGCIFIPSSCLFDYDVLCICIHACVPDIRPDLVVTTRLLDHFACKLIAQKILNLTLVFQLNSHVKYVLSLINLSNRYYFQVHSSLILLPFSSFSQGSNPMWRGMMKH